MIKAVLFDLDNTLIDFMKMKRSSCEAAIKAMISAGLKMDPGKAMELLFKLYDKHGIEYDRIFQAFLEETNKKVDYKLLAAAIVAYRRQQAGLIDPYPEVIPTLLKLREKGIKTAIVSDAPKLKAWIRLTELRLAYFFDAVVTFDDTGERKPSALPFKKALQLLKVKPSEALHIGDWPERDIAGAKKLGITTCFARYGFSGKKIPKTDADHEIDSISELPAIVGMS